MYIFLFSTSRPVRTRDFHLTCQSHSDGSYLFSCICISISYSLLLTHHSSWQSKNHLNVVLSIWQRFNMLKGYLTTLNISGQRHQLEELLQSQTCGSLNSVRRDSTHVCVNKWGNYWNLLSANSDRSTDWPLNRATGPRRGKQDYNVVKM